MDDSLKNSLWNYTSEAIGRGIYSWYDALKVYYIDYYKFSVDDLPGNEFCKDDLNEYFFDGDWYEVYNFIEFTMHNLSEIAQHIKITKEQFEEGLNEILKRELAGYRSINLEIIPITDDNEIASIRSAITVSDKHGFNGIKKHFENSLSLLGKKPEPDYLNSIKESISAVEGICKILTSEKSGGIEKALRKLETKIKLHPAFRQGISNFYGYTSDEDGIRHPILEDSEVDFADAKFMLVSCSALVNYIIEKAIIHNLIPEVS
jgi:hypothetical protein